MKLRCSFFALGCVLASLLPGRAQPIFLYEPDNQSASLGASVIFYSLAYGPEPVTYQWFKNGVALSGQRDDILVLTNVTVAHAADYWVVAAISSGSETSQVATLTVDVAFTKITRGILVNDGGSSAGASWADYDNDGFLDLFVAKGGTDFNQLYHNKGDGTFTRVMTGPVVTDVGNSVSGSWADYDNDGFLDLFVANASSGGFFGGNSTNFLYHNNGDGTFSRLTNATSVVAGNCGSSAWGDFDRDGLLDLVVGNRLGGNFLFRNLGQGLFAQVGFNNEGFKLTASLAWADYDGDGDPDLLAANGGAGGFQNPNEFLYLNNGDGTFTRPTNGVLVTSGGNSTSVAWADYDNDGDLDVFLSNDSGQNNFLYHNNGDGTFTAVTAGDIANDGGDSQTCAWGDYDNDGFLDLFVCNQTGQNNFLYRNTGNGAFTKITTGSLVNDGGNSISATWADYDNDGFLDLFVTNLSGDNFLYRNSGNSNAWIKIRCVGKAANRWGVGAKVRVLATIDGAAHWQMREIAARDGLGSPDTLYAEFGLGDATNLDTVRIEWPNGVMQELHNVSTRQFLTVTEPPSMSIAGTASVGEGDTGLQDMIFTVLLNTSTNTIVAVDFFTRDGTATNGLDYVATNGTVVFNPGETNRTFAVKVFGNLEDDGDRTFFVTLTNATVLPIAFKQAVGTIVDDDPLAVVITDGTVLEGDSGTTNVVVTLNLNKAVDYLVSVDFTNVSSRATAGVDYIKTNGTLVFAPGEISKPISITVLGDRLDEDNEIIFVNLSRATNVVLTDTQGTATIVDDDPAPSLFINNVSILEGHSGTDRAVFDVTLSAVSGRAITVAYSTTNGTAEAPFDYTAKSGALSFVPGTTNQALFVIVNGDTVLEGNETFFVNLSNPVNVLLGNSQGTGTIVDDDFRISGGQIINGRFTFSFPTLTGRNFLIESSDSLSGSPVWTTVAGGASVPGTGTVMQFIDPDPPTRPQRFYRVSLLPP